MSKIVTRKLGFEESPSPDVAGYNLYYSVKTASPLDYDDSFVDVGIPPTETFNGATVHVVILNDAIPGISDGEYQFGVAAYDGAGNEASIVETTLYIDVTPPEPVPFVGDVS